MDLSRWTYQIQTYTVVAGENQILIPNSRRRAVRFAVLANWALTVKPTKAPTAHGDGWYSPVAPQAVELTWQHWGPVICESWYVLAVTPGDLLTVIELLYLGG